MPFLKVQHPATFICKSLILLHKEMATAAILTFFPFYIRKRVYARSNYYAKMGCLPDRLYARSLKIRRLEPLVGRVQARIATCKKAFKIKDLQVLANAYWHGNC